MTEEKIEYRDFRIIQAESDNVKAIMELKTCHTDRVNSGPLGFKKFVGKGRGDVYYFSNVKFSIITYDINCGINYEAIVNLSYGCHSLKGIFERLHANESNIEVLLSDEFDSKKWMLSRNVMKCIIVLEDKIGRREEPKSSRIVEINGNKNAAL